MRLFFAIAVFFRILFSAEAAQQVRRALETAAGEEDTSPPEAETREIKKPPRPKPAARSEAVTLLSALQREARLVDIVKEPLADYSDEQIGAAARDVLRDCGAALDRFFGIEAILDQEEGEAVEVAAGFDPGCWRLTGNVQGEPPFSGSLVHHGWQATRCELPAFSGSEQAARVVAPAEVELK